MFTLQIWEKQSLTKSLKLSRGILGALTCASEKGELPTLFRPYFLVHLPLRLTQPVLPPHGYFPSQWVGKKKKIFMAPVSTEHWARPEFFPKSPSFHPHARQEFPSHCYRRKARPLEVKSWGTDYQLFPDIPSPSSRTVLLKAEWAPE